MSKTQSFFLVIEGLDGSGKSEISRRLAQTLRETHDNVKLTFEPHDPSAAGLYIRQVLTKKLTISARTLALAFALNRADHVEREIEPFLTGNGNRIIVSDRYYLSSLVYQSVPNQISIEEVWELNRKARKPDLTIFLYADPSICYGRIRGRASDRELFEHNLVEKRGKYSQAIQFLRERGESIVEVDAGGTLIEVLNDVIGAILTDGPDWLHIQRPLLVADTGRVDWSNAEFSNITLPDISSYSKLNGSKNGSNGKTLTQRISELIDNMSPDELDNLFFGYIQSKGYELGEQIQWTEMIAYNLRYKLPIATELSGIALVLRESQRYDTITRKMQELESMQKAADFILVLDPTSNLIEPSKQYEREITTRLSSSVCIIGRKNLAEYIAQEVTEQKHDGDELSQSNKLVGI